MHCQTLNTLHACTWPSDFLLTWKKVFRFWNMRKPFRLAISSAPKMYGGVTVWGGERVCTWAVIYNAHDHRKARTGCGSGGRDRRNALFILRGGCQKVGLCKTWWVTTWPWRQTLPIKESRGLFFYRGWGKSMSVYPANMIAARRYRRRTKEGEGMCECMDINVEEEIVWMSVERQSKLN